MCTNSVCWMVKPKLQETFPNLPCARQVSPLHFQCCIVFTAWDPRAQVAAYVVTWPSAPGLHPSTALVGIFVSYKLSITDKDSILTCCITCIINPTSYVRVTLENLSYSNETHAHTHTHLYLYALYLYLPQPELTTWPPFRGWASGGNTAGGPAGSRDVHQPSTAAWPPQCIGVLTYGLARSMRWESWSTPFSDGINIHTHTDMYTCAENVICPIQWWHWQGTVCNLSNNTLQLVRGQRDTPSTKNIAFTKLCSNRCRCRVCWPPPP